MICAHNLLIPHANVRSLFGKIIKFNEFVIENEPDIILLSETWLKPEISTSIVSIDNYKLIRQYRIAHAGGVAIYIKNHFKYDTIVSEDTIEQLWIQLRLKGITLVIGVVYNPHRT